jgi:assimilatory nitrate reductase catalytic subunit
VLRYEDAGLARARAVRVEGDRVVAVRQSGPGAADGSTAWLREALIGDRSVAALMRWLLAPRPPRGEPVLADPVVCVCAGVREASILASLRTLAGSSEQRLAALGSELGCGRQCGGCVPRLRELADGRQQTRAASSPSLSAQLS